MNPEVVFVGGGFRTTTFLASAPALLDKPITVLEASRSFGPGGFSRYTITSTSVGSRFFKEVAPEGRFAAVLADPAVAPVATADEPIPMPALAGALQSLGRAVADVLGHRLQLGRRVQQVAVRSRGTGVQLTLDDGRCLTSRFAVLATGRSERPHPGLAEWGAKTWRSGDVISHGRRAELMDRLAAADGAEIVIAGCSHSAMSALAVLLDIRAQLHQRDTGYRGPVIRVLRRSPTRLAYDSEADARASQVPGRELIFDPATDVCPATGIVFRDSGLRHESRDLFLAAWAGQLADVSICDRPSLGDARPLLDDAALVVQALGYHGSAPDIVVDGRLVRPSGTGDRLTADDHGAAIIEGHPHDALSVLRVEPTPLALRDHAVYGSGLYRRLAERIAGQLATVPVEAP